MKEDINVKFKELGRNKGTLPNVIELSKQKEALKNLAILFI